MLRQTFLIRLQSPRKHFAAPALAELHVGVQQAVQSQQLLVRSMYEVLVHSVRHLAERFNRGNLIRGM